MANEHHRDWSELMADFLHELTERNAEIQFDHLEVEIPVSADAAAPRAPWKLNGSIRIKTQKA